jgi:hypothetical protein
VDPLEQFVRSGLELAGVEVTDSDIQVIRVADAFYGPEVRALAAADLKGVWPELDFDPSRAPTGSAGPAAGA